MATDYRQWHGFATDCTDGHGLPTTARLCHGLHGWPRITGNGTALPRIARMVTDYRKRQGFATDCTDFTDYRKARIEFVQLLRSSLPVIRGNPCNPWQELAVVLCRGFV
jgi:hypothetical protein